MAKLKATPKNFAEAIAVLGSKSNIRLGNNTHLIKTNERVYSAGRIAEERVTVGVRLHNTQIVKFYEDGRITLHTGGYYSNTTKDRINQFITGRVWQKNFNWFYTPGACYSDGKVLGNVPFVEGMEVR